MAAKTRSFTGCTTCRARKVKCDLTRPKCLRCTKAKLECGGYDIKLGWSKPLSVGEDNSMITVSDGVDDSAEDNKFERRNVELVKFPKSSQYTTYNKLSQIVEEVDTRSEAYVKRIVVGPFGVYRLHIQASGTRKPKRRRVEESIEPFEQVTPALEEKSSLIFSKTDNSYVHYDLLMNAKLTIIAIKGSNYVFNEQNMFHILYPKYFPNVDSDDWEANPSTIDHFIVQKGNDLVIKPYLKNIGDEITADLFSFILINYPHNYFDTLMKPFLMEILAELTLLNLLEYKTLIIDNNTEYSKRQLSSHLKLGIVYLLLSIITFQKNTLAKDNLRIKDEELKLNNFIKISTDLRKLGMKIINYHLDEYDMNISKFSHQDNYEVLMILSIILAITIDNYFGVFENYELFYAIGDYIIKHQFKKKRHELSGLSKYLMNVFKIMSIFYESTQSINLFNYSMSKKDENSKYGDLHDDYDLIGGDDEEEDDEQDVDDYEDEEEDEDESLDDQEEGEGDGEEEEESRVLFRPKIKKITDEITQNYNPMSFTVTFNKRNDSDFEEDETVEDMEPKSQVIPHPNTLGIFKLESSYLMYGAPKKLLDLFHEIIHLTNHKNIFENRQIKPRNFPKICADIEDRLVNFDVERLWKLFEVRYNPITNRRERIFISRFHEMVWLNTVSLHNAIIVYFHRLIKQSPIETYQQYIETSLNQLNQLVTKYGNDRDIKINPSFWPILVCGCDIDLQKNRHLQKLCERLWNYHQYTKYNYWRSKQILFEIWKRREIGEDHSLMDMVREWGIILNLG